MKTLGKLLGGVTLGFVSLTAQSAVITWDFVNTTFYDGTGITGSASTALRHLRSCQRARRMCHAVSTRHPRSRRAQRCGLGRQQQFPSVGKERDEEADTRGLLLVPIQEE